VRAQQHGGPAQYARTFGMGRLPPAPEAGLGRGQGVLVLCSTQVLDALEQLQALGLAL